METFLVWYGSVSLGLWFILWWNLGPSSSADLNFYGWKKSLGIITLELLACPLYLPLLGICLVYLGGFYLYQNFIRKKK